MRQPIDLVLVVQHANQVQACEVRGGVALEAWLAGKTG